MRYLKKSTLSLLLILLSISFSYSQESRKYLRIKKNNPDYLQGYILNKGAVRIEGLVKDNVLNETGKYSRVTFIFQDGTKARFRPDGIKGFGFWVYDYVSDDAKFYEVVQRGKKVTLYKRLREIPHPKSLESCFYDDFTIIVEDFYLKRVHEGVFKPVNEEGFNKEFSEYFADCEKTANKIRNEELTYADILEVVKQYNRSK